MAAQMLQAIDRAVEICCDDIVGAAAIAGMDAGLGRAFDQPVGGTRLGQILARTDVAMDKADATGGQPAERKFAAPATQIVEGGNLSVRINAFKPERR